MPKFNYILITFRGLGIFTNTDYRKKVVSLPPIFDYGTQSVEYK